MRGDFDAYHKWLGIPPAEQPPDHYRLLGIQRFEADADVIDTAADGRMAILRGFQAGSRSVLSQQLLNEIAAARVCLLDADQRAEYDRRLRYEEGGSTRTAVPSSDEGAYALQPLETSPTRSVMRKALTRARSTTRDSRANYAGPTVVLASLLGLVAAVWLVSSGGWEQLQSMLSSHDQSDPDSEAEATTSAAVARNAKPVKGNASKQTSTKKRALSMDADATKLNTKDPNDIDLLRSSTLLLNFEETTLQKKGKFTRYQDVLGRKAYGDAVGATVLSGVVGSGLEFDGKNNHIRTSIRQSEVSTLTMWLQIKKAGDLTQLLAGSGNGAGYAVNWQPSRPQKLSLLIGTGRKYVPYRFAHRLRFGAWHHVALVFDRQERTFGYFVNGEREFSTAIARCAREDEFHLVLSTQFRGHALRGAMDEVAIFDRVLSAHEISRLHTLGRKRRG